MQNYNQIITNLQTAKKNSGLTLKQLAEKSGLTQGTVNKIMSGALKSIKTEKLEKLANALNVSINSLIGNVFSVEEQSNEFFGYVKIACISPKLKVGDCAFNAKEIVAQAVNAEKNHVQIALFPELCITGYTCGDLFFQQTLLENAQKQLLFVAKALQHVDTVVVVGLPLVNQSNKLYNVACVLYKGKILGCIPKKHLPNYNEFSEKRYFTPAPLACTTIQIGQQTVPFGTELLFRNTFDSRFTFAVEICEDVWVNTPPSCEHTKHGANIVLNLSASNETVVKATYRLSMITMQSAKTVCTYAYCSAGPDESTTDTVFSAHNIICENGNVLAQSKPFGQGYCEALADVAFISAERVHSNHEHETQSNYDIVTFDMPLANGKVRKVDKEPFVPSDKAELSTRAETIFNLQAYGLKRRAEHTGAQKLLVGVSGGADSALALLACCRAVKLMQKPLTDVVAVVLPCKLGTSTKVKNNAVLLANAMGVTVKEIDISASVLQHFKDICHNANNQNVTYQNAQARERTQVLMDLANDLNGLMVGTSDLSEIALGFSTYNGDHMSMYNVNSGVPKTLVLALLKHVAQQSKQPLKQILQDIVATPISPELLPDGANAQQTENIVGPYALHDFFLLYTLRYNFSPAKTFALAKTAFEGTYDDKTIIATMETFYTRFFANQFKRGTSPDGVKIGSVDLSKNGWKMPSDACGALWIDEVEKLQKDVK